MSDLGDKLIILAEKAVDKAIESDDMAVWIETLKTAGTLHIGMMRISGKKGDEDESVGMSMTEMRAKIAEAGNPLLAHSDCNGRFE
jgi:hypothetical protein